MPSLLLSIGYQNKNAFISLSHCYKNETFFFCSPREPAANYTQGCRETLEPRAATPASQLALYLLCSVSVPLTGYINGGKPEQGAVFCFFHTHHSRSLSYYASIQGNLQEVSPTSRSLISSTAPRSLQESLGH